MVLLQFWLVVEGVDVRQATREEEQDQMLGSRDVMSSLGFQRMPPIHGRSVSQPTVNGQPGGGGKGSCLM